ncbi:MAG: S8 family peptidase [Prevotellaceae bacterium]|nr:S8 family peptidase [Prevotellaceae bacterium]
MEQNVQMRAKSAVNEKVHLYIIINDDFDKTALDTLDISIESDFNNILTILSPVESLAALSEMKGIDYISVGIQAKPQLDVAVPLVRADMVQRGISATLNNHEGLEQSYTGKGVIVGIVDLGLDFTHPTFRAADGSLRISRAWVQTSSGNAPAGFRYGTEYVGKNALLGKRYSNDQMSHGTHVAGIAAGGGGTSPYVGVAPEAEIVFVETGGTDTQITDGVRYIFNYAKSQNKPAVVNISMGTQYGSHDGKSATDQAFAEMTGAGKIIVGSAGNNGLDSLHIRKDFADNADTLRTIINISPTDNNNKIGNAIIWGDADTDLQAAFEIYDLDTKERVFRTEFLNTARNAAKLDKTFQRINVKMSVIHRYPTNQKPLVEIEVTNPTNERYGVALVLLGNAGRSADLWNNGFNSSGASFTALANAPTWQMGDNASSITEIGGTSEQVITVGAFNSKTQWRDINGATHSYNGFPLGDISYFSSQGPTADGRIKPDIAAPGTALASAVNAFASDYSPTSRNKIMLVAKENNSYFGIMQGTSMAAPMVTGAVALMLQRNPELTPENIRELLSELAVKDDFTGETANNTWGFGKLDVYNILSSRKMLPKPKLGDVLVYFDAQNHNIILQTAKEHNDETDHRLPISRVEIFDITGKKMLDKRNITDQTVNVSSLRTGIYILRIYSGDEVCRRKTLVYF